MYILREDQQEQVSEAINLSQTTSKHFVVEGVTGIGKTVMMDAIIKFISNNPLEPLNRIIVLTHTKRLIRQLKERVGSNCLFVLWQSASKKKYLHYFATQHNVPFTHIIIDECHKCGANGYNKIFDVLKKAKRIGFSATPIRDDKKSLVKQYGGKELENAPFDVCIEGKSMQEYIDLGILSPFEYYTTGLNVDKKLTMSGTDFSALSIENNVGRFSFEQALDIFQKTGCKKGIAFCSTIKHAHQFKDFLTEFNVLAEVVSSKMTENELERTFRLYSEGRFNILISCQMLIEGIDIPDCDSIIQLRPTHSVTIFLQCIGRGTRKVEGKLLKIIDCVGNVKRHNLPNIKRSWYIVGKKDKIEATGGGLPPVGICGDRLVNGKIEYDLDTIDEGIDKDKKGCNKSVAGLHLHNYLELIENRFYWRCKDCKRLNPTEKLFTKSTIGSIFMSQYDKVYEILYYCENEYIKIFNDGSFLRRFKHSALYSISDMYTMHQHKRPYEVSCAEIYVSSKEMKKENSLESRKIVKTFREITKLELDANNAFKNIIRWCRVNSNPSGFAKYLNEKS